MSLLRDFSMGINYVEITLELIVALYFFWSYRTERLRATEFAAIGFFSLAVTRVCYIIYDYYVLDMLFVYLAWGLLGISIIFIVISLFKGVSRSIFDEFRHKIAYFIGFGIYFIVIIAIIHPLNNIIIYLVGVGVGIILLVPLILRFNKLVEKTGGYIKRYLSFAIIGIPLSFLAIGIGPLWRDLPEIQGWILKIGAHFLFLISLILLTASLLKLPTLNELDWEKMLSNLYIIIPKGFCIYSFNFKQTRSINPQLLSGGLTGIIAMVQEMTKSKKKLSFIRSERKNLYVEYGKNVMVALLGEEELKVIFNKLEQFTREFERLFPDISTWSYSTEEFKISSMLVRSIFSI